MLNDASLSPYQLDQFETFCRFDLVGTGFQSLEYFLDSATDSESAACVTHSFSKI